MSVPVTAGCAEALEAVRAAMLDVLAPDGRPRCHGTRTADERVLTAAHCIAGAARDGARDSIYVAPVTGATGIAVGEPRAGDDLVLVRAAAAPCPVALVQRTANELTTTAACDVEPGDSGSPLVRCEAGRVELVGVLSGARVYGSSREVVLAPPPVDSQQSELSPALVAVATVVIVAKIRRRSAGARS